MTSRGIRNNNPGNIRASSVHWVGELTPDPEGFCVFDTAQNGIAAMGRNLAAYQDAHGLRTVQGIISRWSATDQAVYITNVSNALHVRPADVIDIHNPNTLVALVKAIIQQENAAQPYSDVLIRTVLLGPHVVKDSMPDTPQPSLLDILGPVASMINPIAGSLITAFGPTLQQKLAKEINRHTDDPAAGQQIATNLSNLLITQAQQISGKSDPVDAAAAVRTDPALLAKAEATVGDDLEKLGPILQQLVDIRKADTQINTASADAASMRADASDVRKRFDRRIWRAYGIAAVLLVGIAGAELAVTGTVDGQIVGALILAFGALGAMLQTMNHYGYGTSGSSGAKDVVIGEIAKGKA